MELAGSQHINCGLVRTLMELVLGGSAFMNVLQIPFVAAAASLPAKKPLAIWNAGFLCFLGDPGLFKS